jgi:hypothetical protein
MQALGRRCPGTSWTHDDAVPVIVVCEPISKAFSHEKVNSGFLVDLRLAFPLEPIRVYADPSHIRALEDILEHDGQSLPMLEFMPIDIGNCYRLSNIPGCWRTLRSVLRGAAESGAGRILFLSFNPMLLLLVKCTRRGLLYGRVKCALVLHGDFEEIAHDRAGSPVPPLPRPSLRMGIRKTSLAVLPGKAFRHAGHWLLARSRAAVQSLLKALVPMKRALEWRHSADFRYIALSPHVPVNARPYIDTEALNMAVVPMPIVFARPSPPPANAHPKFAVFGYGDSAMLHQILAGLSESPAAGLPYEIRIIGMDDRGIAGFRNVTTPSPGKPMSRAEMESQARDIDAFLILYTGESYRMSCSGSIFEALSYVKPVLHFENACVDQFNTPDRPIGMRAGSTRQFVDNMVAIILDFGKFSMDAERYRENILALRREYGMAAWVGELRDVLTWPASC